MQHVGPSPALSSEWHWWFDSKCSLSHPVQWQKATFNEGNFPKLIPLFHFQRKLPLCHLWLMHLNLLLLYRSASFLVEVNYRQICIMRTKQSLYLLSGASLNKTSALCKFLKRSTMHKEEPSNQLERYKPYVDCRFHLISCQYPNLETSLCKFINALGHLKGRIL